MEDNIVWGYNAIYGEKKPEYHESFGREEIKNSVR